MEREKEIERKKKKKKKEEYSAAMRASAMRRQQVAPVRQVAPVKQVAPPSTYNLTRQKMEMMRRQMINQSRIKDAQMEKQKAIAQQQMVQRTAKPTQDNIRVSGGKRK